MKYILTLLASLLLAAPTFAQQYANALQVPDLVKKGLKGKVKKVVTTTYKAMMVNGEPKPDSLESVQVDSFDTNGFLVSEHNLTEKTTMRYFYKNGMLDHRIFFEKNKKTIYYKPVAEGPFRYSFSKHNYDGKGINYNDNPSGHETYVLNKQQLNDSVFSISDMFTYNSYKILDAEKKITEVYASLGENYFSAFKDTFLKNDKMGNTLGMIRIYNPGWLDKKQIMLIGYEYYE